MNPCLQLDPGGESYFYGTHLNSGCVPHFNVTLTVHIDGKVLYQTMQEMMQRFPQMAVGIEKRETRYFLKHLTAEFPVFKDDGTTVREMGSEEMNGYLILVSYMNKSIRFDFLHVLGDGTGFIAFIKAVVYRYLELAGFPIENDGSILTVDQPFTPEESESVVDRLEEKGFTPPEWYVPHDAFKVPGISTDDDPSDTVVQVRIPFHKLKGVVKSYQSSPVTFIEPLFSHAIYEKYKDIIGDQTIVASIPVNMRPFFPTKTLRYFIAVAVLVHSNLFLSESFENMLLTQKKLLKEQMDPDFLSFLARSQKKGMEQMLSLPMPVEQKVEIMDQSIRKALGAYTYIITNMGNVDLPEVMSQYVTEFYPLLPTSIAPFTIAATTLKDELILSISQRSEKVDVCKRFVDLLNFLEIPAYIADIYKFHTMTFLPK